MYSINDYERLIDEACGQTPEGMAKPDLARRPILPFLEREQAQFPAETARRLYQNTLQALADYLDHYPAGAVFRQRLWETFNAWSKWLADRLGVSDPQPFMDYRKPPVEPDLGVGLVKQLHTKEGKTKAEIARELKIGEKTIQTNLRMLDPTLQEAGKRPKPLRLGGQELRVKILHERQGSRDTFRTPERLHPVVLQLNTMQVGHLLRALQMAYDHQSDEVARFLALDIWSQLSTQGRDRIIEIYSQKYPELIPFFADLKDACKSHIPVFLTETELWEELEIPARLEAAFKGGRVVNLEIKRDGETKKLDTVRLHISPKGHEYYLAVPANEPTDEAKAELFSVEEVRAVTAAWSEKD